MKEKNVGKRAIRGISKTFLVGTLLIGPCITAKASEKVPDEQAYDLTEEEKENLEKYFRVEEDNEKLNKYYEDYREEIDINDIYSKRIGYYEGSYKEDLCYGEKNGERLVKINYNYDRDENDNQIKVASNILGGVSLSSNLDAAELVVKYNKANIPDDVKEKLENCNKDDYGIILNKFLINNDVKFYVPVSEAEDIYVDVVNKHKNIVIDTACDYNVELSEAQIMALTDFSFMYGDRNLKGLFKHLETEGELSNFKTASETSPFEKNLENVTDYDELNNSKLRNAYRRAIIENCGLDDNSENWEKLSGYVTDIDGDKNIFLYDINQYTTCKITDKNWLDVNKAKQDEVANYETWMKNVYYELDIENNEKYTENKLTDEELKKIVNIILEEAEREENKEESEEKENELLPEQQPMLQPEIIEEQKDEEVTDLVPIKKPSKLASVFRFLSAGAMTIAEFFRRQNRAKNRNSRRAKQKNIKSNNEENYREKNEKWLNEKKKKEKKFKDSIRVEKEIDYEQAYKIAEANARNKKMENRYK